jgi:hypothetical protein
MDKSLMSLANVILIRVVHLCCSFVQFIRVVHKCSSQLKYRKRMARMLGYLGQQTW